MFLSLESFQESDFEIPVSSEVTFGYYMGESEPLLEAVGQVEKGWPSFFTENSLVYCAYVDGEIASFCLIEDMGTYRIDGKTIKVGGPGCVGTVPKFRRRGIGLSMVSKATSILKEKGYDYSYIHYTGVASWYAKLGYRTEIRWGKNGILQD